MSNGQQWVLRSGSGDSAELARLICGAWNSTTSAKLPVRSPEQVAKTLVVPVGKKPDGGVPISPPWDLAESVVSDTLLRLANAAESNEETQLRFRNRNNNTFTTAKVSGIQLT